MKWLLYGLAAVAILAVIVIAGAALLDTQERPAPAEAVGYSNTQITAAHREVPLDVHIWYPPADPTAPATLQGQNALFYGSYVIDGATPLSAPAPVIVVSHGSGGNMVGISWLATALAGQGYIVIGANHPGTTSRDSIPERTVQIWERPQDMTALLDWLTQTPPAVLMPDLERVGAVGFSLGGGSVLGLAGLQYSKEAFIAYCAEIPDEIDCGWMNAAGVDFSAINGDLYDQSNLDARVRAVAAIDPALVRAVQPGSAEVFDVPALVINLGDPADIPSGMVADALAASLADASYVSIPGAYHFSFLAECSALGRIVISLAGDDNICADPGTRPRPAVHADVLEQIVPFLAQNL